MSEPTHPASPECRCEQTGIVQGPHDCPHIGCPFPVAPLEGAREEPILRRAWELIDLQEMDLVAWSDEQQIEVASILRALIHTTPPTQQAEIDRLTAIVSDPQKWMQWCDHRVLERAEAAEASLAAARHENQRLEDTRMGEWHRAEHMTTSFNRAQEQLAAAQAEIDRLTAANALTRHDPA